MLPNDLDQRLRKFEDVRKDNLSLELGMPNAA